METDALFKTLLQSFFAEFMTLFLPKEAAQVEWESVRFLSEEAFTNLTGGAVRRPDVLAQVQARDGTIGLVLFHTEIQDARRRIMRFRMWEYYSVLRFKHQLPVIPIAIYLSGGTGGITLERYTEGIFGRTFVTFDYIAIGLPDLPADEYEQKGEPLAVALSALMKQKPKENQGTCKFRLLGAIQNSSLDEAKQMLLSTMVVTQLQLSETEVETYE